MWFLDKPLTAEITKEAKSLYAIVEKPSSQRFFIGTHTYSGYPMIKPSQADDSSEAKSGKVP